MTLIEFFKNIYLNRKFDIKNNTKCKLFFIIQYFYIKNVYILVCKAQ